MKTLEHIFKVSVLALTLSTLVSTASAESIDPVPVMEATEPDKIYTFKAPNAASKDKPLATLQFTSNKKAAHLVLEGRGLKKGKYSIIKVPTCDSLPKTLPSQKTNGELREIFSFETEYGDISTEKNLELKEFEEMALENASLALISAGSKSRTVLSCAK